ncbi:reproductive homeobox 3H [Mus musculus]|uniref:Reproductive homeobox 3H n=1 Tax=Mus musculus TaxID=10090 RepID=L7MU37_MOUSE|nr:reproductive homeobox 3H [Mus musculus]|eukprot:NP_001107629.1 reproductive homeobox 3H [Mus musculus]
MSMKPERSISNWIHSNVEPAGRNLFQVNGHRSALLPELPQDYHRASRSVNGCETKMDSTQGTKVLPAEESRNEEDGGQVESALGATAARGRGKEALNGESPAAAGTAGLVEEDRNKEDGGTKGGEKNEQEVREQIPEHVEGESDQAEAPRQVPRRRLHHRFTQWQLDELERIFRMNYFLSLEARKQLARWMGVNEAIVKRWFQKRREQYRWYKRL